MIVRSCYALSHTQTNKHTHTHTHTQVGAVVVNPKTKEVVGTGWNRMPRGCEDRFKWTRDKEKEPLECGKHLFGMYSILYGLSFPIVLVLANLSTNTMGYTIVSFLNSKYMLFCTQLCMGTERQYSMPIRMEPT